MIEEIFLILKACKPLSKKEIVAYIYISIYMYMSGQYNNIGSETFWHYKF